VIKLGECFPNNLPDYFDWKISWEKRKDFLVDMMKGDRTLGEIGITPENN
jgi:hypothetical protein